MKVTVSIDFGEDELVSSADIKITHSVERSTSQLWFDPDMRDVIAGALAPLLSTLHMPEREISDVINEVYAAPVLFGKSGKGGYRYCADENRLKYFLEETEPRSQKRKNG